MKLNEPKVITYLISCLLGVVALVAQLAIPALQPYAIWIALVGLALLAAGNYVKGL